MADFFKPDSGTVEQVVTQSVIKAMEKAGFKIVPVNRVLNQDREDFKDIPGDVALGGRLNPSGWRPKPAIQPLIREAKLRIRLSGDSQGRSG
jgi:hypothetical protein